MNEMFNLYSVLSNSETGSSLLLTNEAEMKSRVYYLLLKKNNKQVGRYKRENFSTLQITLSLKK